MLQNPILFHAFDIDWTVGKCCVVGWIGVWLLGCGLPMTYLLKRTGQTRAMTQAELTESIGNVGDEPRDYAVASGVGVKVEASASIDTLRRAANRADWLLFWMWPLFFFNVGLGWFLLLAAIGVGTRDVVFLMSLGAGCALLFALPALFLPYAALYTNIDLDVDGAEPDAADSQQK